MSSTPRLTDEPVRLRAAGATPKTIEEYVGLASSDSDHLSVARMHSPAGWSEPGQTPAFDEHTIVLEGTLVIEHAEGAFEVHAGQAVHTPAGTWVRYSTPAGADYLAVCTPAFSPERVHRDHHAEDGEPGAR